MRFEDLNYPPKPECGLDAPRRSSYGKHGRPQNISYQHETYRPPPKPAKPRRNWKPLIITAVVAVALLTAFIPYQHYDKHIEGGRWLSEGIVTIIDEDENRFAVQLLSKGQITATMAYLEGSLPKSIHLGQRVNVGYSGEGLASTVELGDSKAEVSFLETGNVLVDFLLKQVVPSYTIAADYTILDYVSDGTQLNYYVARTPGRNG